MGISVAISFAVTMWNGDEWDVALIDSIYTGLKVGGTAWLGSIITASTWKNWNRTKVYEAQRTEL